MNSHPEQTESWFRIIFGDCCLPLANIGAAPAPHFRDDLPGFLSFNDSPNMPLSAGARAANQTVGRQG